MKLPELKRRFKNRYVIRIADASTTPFGLALAPGYLEADEPSFKNLRLSAIMILT